MIDSIPFSIKLVAHHLLDSSSQDWDAKDSGYNFPLGVLCGLIQHQKKYGAARRLAAKVQTALV